MTLIHCEHCGTRIYPHDTACPTRQVEVHRGEIIGYTNEAPMHQGFLHYQPLENPWPTPAAVTLSPHKTVMSVTGPWCQCGYNPRDEHPTAEPGQLFAYIGQHIRAINDANRRHP